jgi:hypothetical protein
MDTVHVEEDVPEQGIVPTIPDPIPTVAAIPIICRDINAIDNLMGQLMPSNAVANTMEQNEVESPRHVFHVPLSKSVRRTSTKLYPLKA